MECVLCIVYCVLCIVYCLYIIHLGVYFYSEFLFDAGANRCCEVDDVFGFGIVCVDYDEWCFAYYKEFGVDAEYNYSTTNDQIMEQKFFIG